MSFQFSSKTVLITGGSSGIGLATAKKLAQKGAHLILIARNLELLQRAEQSIKTYRIHTDQQVVSLCADVSKEEVILPVLENVFREYGVPDVLINCAGIAQAGYFENLDLGVFQSMNNTNYIGTVIPTKIILPGMLERGSGVIVNVASMAAIISLPGYTAYGASKFAVRGFTEALRNEVKGKGIHLVLVYPPDTDTPQHQSELADRPEEVNILSGDDALPPEVVADAMIKAIERNQFMVIPGVNNWAIYWLQSILGPFSYFIIDLAISLARRRSNHSDSQ